MSADSEADEAETKAFHGAFRRFMGPFLEELLATKGLGALASSSHEHAFMIADGTGKAMMLRMRISFGDVVAQKDVAELMGAALDNPGKVTLA